MISGRSQAAVQRLVLAPNQEQREEATLGAYYEGFNEKLYAALPVARRILELGCATGRLGQRYKQAHPDAFWAGIDINPAAVEIASTRLDQAYCLNLDEAGLDDVGAAFDCIVFGDLLEHLKRPEQLLTILNKVAEENATLVCCVPNMGHFSVLERILSGDLSYDNEGLLDRTHLRFYSRPSLFKMLLDCGWLPNLQDSYLVGVADSAFARNLIGSAGVLGVPTSIAADQLFSYQMIVRCGKRAKSPTSAVHPFSVIVPVTNEAQLSLNVLRSPGLAEARAEVILVRDAGSAADAYHQGAQAATHPWLLFCHQDVYFPSGTGFEISSLLASISPADASRSILGFAGMALEGASLRKAGLVVDRSRLFDFAASSQATSLDEFCIAMHRSCAYEIAPELGWHLWATDLCLQALHDPRGPSFGSIARVPLFHNSVNDGTLSDAYRASEGKLLNRYPNLSGIVTLCSTMQRSEAVPQVQ